MVHKADSRKEKDAASNSRRKRFNTKRRLKDRHSKLAQVASIAGLALSIGTALYRFRKQWVPKVEEIGEEIRARMARSTS